MDAFTCDNSECPEYGVSKSLRGFDPIPDRPNLTFVRPDLPICRCGTCGEPCTPDQDSEEE